MLVSGGALVFLVSLLNRSPYRLQQPDGITMSSSERLCVNFSLSDTVFYLLSYDRMIFSASAFEFRFVCVCVFVNVAL
jgi:hypothetical protein